MTTLTRPIRREITSPAGAVIVTLRLSRDGEALLELRAKGRHTGSLFNISHLGARVIRETRVALPAAALLESRQAASTGS